MQISAPGAFELVAEGAEETRQETVRGEDGPEGAVPDGFEEQREGQSVWAPARQVPVADRGTRVLAGRSTEFKSYFPYSGSHWRV